MIAFNTLGQAAYEELRREIIADVEQLREAAYFDSASDGSKATIGYGYNLAEGTIREAVFTALGMGLARPLTPDQLAQERDFRDRITHIVTRNQDADNTPITDDAQLQAAINAVMAERATYFSEQGITVEHSTFEFDDRDEALEVFDVAARAFEAEVNRWIYNEASDFNDCRSENDTDSCAFENAANLGTPLWSIGEPFGGYKELPERKALDDTSG